MKYRLLLSFIYFLWSNVVIQVECMFFVHFIYVFHYLWSFPLLISSYVVVELFFFRVRNNIRFHVGDVDAAAVPCGFGRAIGNKVGLQYLLC